MNERFAGEGAEAYRRRARRLIPDYDGLHEAASLRLSEAQSVLSVGCGDGEDLLRLSAPKLVGIDLSPDMIRLAAQRLGERARLLVGNADDLDGTYEAVSAILVGHFVRYEERDAFYASLRPRCEGQLVVAELIAPVDAEIWVERMIANGTDDEKARSAVSRAVAELFPLTREELVASVERAGFQLSEEFWSVEPFSALAFRSS